MHKLEKFTGKIADAITFAMANEIPPIYVVGILEAVKTDLVTKINTSAPGRANPSAN